MVYILGAGSIGSLLAMELRQSGVQFIMRPSTLAMYAAAGKKVSVTNELDGARFESEIDATSADALPAPVDQLVLAVKAYDVYTALAQLKRAITPATELLIVHNGMGVAELLEKLWSPAEMPKVAFGITSAGVRRAGPLWDFRYGGLGTAHVASMDARPHALADALAARSALLETTRLPLRAFVAEQRSKLIVNAAINPLTALLECPNGALRTLGAHNSVVPRLVSESCSALGVPADAERMLGVVSSVVDRTRANLSSMLKDVEQGRPTESDFISGYIVRQAKARGVYAPLNYMLHSLVQMRAAQARHELARAVPWADEAGPP